MNTYTTEELQKIANDFLLAIVNNTPLPESPKDILVNYCTTDGYNAANEPRSLCEEVVYCAKPVVIAAQTTSVFSHHMGKHSVNLVSKYLVEIFLRDDMREAYEKFHSEKYFASLAIEDAAEDKKEAVMYAMVK